jgi:hypothetical protein
VSQALRAGLLALCLGASLTACSLGGGEKASETGASGRSSATENVTIESSLDGFEVLPRRIRWTVTTSLPPEQVRGVRFLVDSDRWWGDDDPPYSYGVEGAFLPTAWIGSLSRSNAVHTFEVRVFATHGDSWREKVRVRLPSARLVANSPGASNPGYRGYYGYGRLSAADLASPPPPDKLPGYRAHINFIGAALFVTEDRNQFAWEMSSERRHLHLGTPIFIGSHAEPAKVHGYRELDDVLCAPDGPPAVYERSYMKGRLVGRYRGENHYARYLRLSAVRDPCRERKKMLEGVWDEFS